MIHNALQRFTELQRGAKVALGLDAGAGGLERMSETLQLVKDFWRYPSDALLRGARLGQGGVFVAAGGAGNYSAVAVDQPNDGWITVLRAVEFTTPTAGIVAMKRGVAFPTASNNRSHVDVRVDNVLPMSRVTTINNVAAVPGGTTCGAWYVAANSTLRVDVNAVLVSVAPVATESAIIIYHGTANSAIAVTAYWEERRLLPGELFR